MSDIRTVTIHIIALENIKLRRYTVEYSTGMTETYGIPPEKVEKFIRENSREFTKVKFKFEVKEEK